MDKIAAIEYYQELFTELNLLICKWDPYGLSNKGEIADEFREEVSSILANLRDNSSSEDVIEIVSNIFSKSFSPEDFDLKACANVGLIIYEWWNLKK